MSLSDLQAIRLGEGWTDERDGWPDFVRTHMHPVAGIRLAVDWQWVYANKGSEDQNIIVLDPVLLITLNETQDDDLEVAEDHIKHPLDVYEAVQLIQMPARAVEERYFEAVHLLQSGWVRRASEAARGLLGPAVVSPLSPQQRALLAVATNDSLAKHIAVTDPKLWQQIREALA